MEESAKPPCDVLNTACQRGAQMAGMDKTMTLDQSKNADIPLREVKRRKTIRADEPWLPQPRFLHITILSFLDSQRERTCRSTVDLYVLNGAGRPVLGP